MIAVRDVKWYRTLHCRKDDTVSVVVNNISMFLRTGADS
jgi:hypothetical protein